MDIIKTFRKIVEFVNLFHFLSQISENRQKNL